MAQRTVETSLEKARKKAGSRFASPERIGKTTAGNSLKAQNHFVGDMASILLTFPTRLKGKPGRKKTTVCGKIRRIRSKIDTLTKDNMAKYKLEYIWLDGYEPIANIRGKTLIKDFDSFPTLEQVPNWGFDGSSTKQAEGRASDCVLKPVGVYPDATKTNAAIVMSEVLLPDGTPHPTNARATIIDDPDTWFGFEQEYFLYKDGRPLGFPKEGYPPPQGKYYTGVWLRSRRGCRARDCGQASRSVSLRRRQSRRNQCGGRQGSVGIPDLRQGLEEGGGRCMGRPLSHGSPR